MIVSTLKNQQTMKNHSIHRNGVHTGTCRPHRCHAARVRQASDQRHSNVASLPRSAVRRGAAEVRECGGREGAPRLAQRNRRRRW